MLRPHADTLDERSGTIAEQPRPYGARAAMAKPFDLDVLLAAVERLG